jgi:hypothetical protein
MLVAVSSNHVAAQILILMSIVSNLTVTAFLVALNLRNGPDWSALASFISFLAVVFEIIGAIYLW